jgi:hypothetical protein
MRLASVFAFGILAAGFLAASTPPASAAEWCGFLDKNNAKVTCGYSSLEVCKQALGDKKDAVCMPDPSFADRQRLANG